MRSFCVWFEFFFVLCYSQRQNNMSEETDNTTTADASSSYPSPGKLVSRVAVIVLLVLGALFLQSSIAPAAIPSSASFGREEVLPSPPLSSSTPYTTKTPPPAAASDRSSALDAAGEDRRPDTISGHDDDAATVIGGSAAPPPTRSGDDHAKAEAEKRRRRTKGSNGGDGEYSYGDVPVYLKTTFLSWQNKHNRQRTRKSEESPTRGSPSSSSSSTSNYNNNNNATTGNNNTAASLFDILSIPREDLLNDPFRDRINGNRFGPVDCKNYRKCYRRMRANYWFGSFEVELFRILMPDVMFRLCSDKNKQLSKKPGLKQRSEERQTMMLTAVIDIGANTGEETVELAKLTSRLGCKRSDGRNATLVLSFEPIEKYHADLRKIASKYDDIVRFIPKGVGPVDGQVVRFVGETSAAHQLQAGEEPKKGEAVTTVLLASLEAELARRNVDRVGILKIDAEGFDYYIIRSFHELLRKSVTVIIFEINGVPSAHTNLQDALEVIERDFRIFFAAKPTVPRINELLLLEITKVEAACLSNFDMNNVLRHEEAIAIHKRHGSHILKRLVSLTPNEFAGKRAMTSKWQRSTLGQPMFEKKLWKFVGPLTNNPA